MAQLGLVPALHLLPRRVLQADQARVLQVSCSDRDGCKKTSTVMPDASILQRTRENNEGARTRQVTTNGLATQYARTDVRKYSFAVRVADKWNRLPESVRTATSKETFKRELKKVRN